MSKQTKCHKKFLVYFEKLIPCWGSISKKVLEVLKSLRSIKGLISYSRKVTEIRHIIGVDGPVEPFKGLLELEILVTDTVSQNCSSKITNFDIDLKNWFLESYRSHSYRDRPWNSDLNLRKNPIKYLKSIFWLKSYSTKSVLKPLGVGLG